MKTKDGHWTVSQVTFAETGSWLQIKHYGFHVAYVRTPAEVAAYIDLGRLVAA